MNPDPGTVDESTTYFCGWAITGRTTLGHLVASARFPLAGYSYRAWCGRMVTVIALTLDVRRLPGTCPDCNHYLHALSSRPARALGRDGR